MADVLSNVCFTSATQLLTSDYFSPTSDYSLPLTGYKDGEDLSNISDAYASNSVFLEPFRCDDGTFEGVAVPFEADNDGGP